MVNMRSRFYALLLCLPVVFGCPVILYPEEVGELSGSPVAVKASWRPCAFWRYRREKAEWRHIWKSVSVQLDFGNATDASYVLMIGDDLKRLQDELKAGRQLFGFFRRWRWFESTSLNPFLDSYVGVESSVDYSIQLVIRVVDLRLLVAFLAGCCLYMFADSITQTVASYYVFGALFSIATSVVLLLFLLGRLLPRRSVPVALYWGGFSFLLYVFTMIWQNAWRLILVYKKWFAIYAVLSVAISFAIVYRWGTPVHPRTQKLFQWGLQLIGLALVAFSCQLPQFSVAFVVGMIVTKNFPDYLLDGIIQAWFRWRPPKPRLLTEEEYRIQGVVETRKALNELRSFCQSPECNSWDILERLSEPERFVSFVKGAHHLSDLTESDIEEGMCDVETSSGSYGNGFVHDDDDRLID